MKWLATPDVVGIEREIEASGLVWTFLRPNGFMQNVVNFFAPSIRSQGAFHIPSRGCRIGHIDARDIGAVAAKALTEAGHEGKSYPLSGPEALTCEEIAAKLSAAIGKAVRYVDIPDAEFKKGAIAAGMPPGRSSRPLHTRKFSPNVRKRPAGR